MRDRPAPLPGVQAFEAAARLGSLAVAAGELHLSPAGGRSAHRSLVAAAERL